MNLRSSLINGSSNPEWPLKNKKKRVRGRDVANKVDCIGAPWNFFFVKTRVCVCVWMWYFHLKWRSQRMGWNKLMELGNKTMTVSD